MLSAVGALLCVIFLYDNRKNSIFQFTYMLIFYNVHTYKYSALTRNTAYSVFERQHHVCFESVHCLCGLYTQL